MDVIFRIKDGYYKDLISRCRGYIKNGDMKSYKKYKCSLPAVTFSGMFDKAHKAGNLLNYSNVIVVDIDNVSLFEIENIKYNISKDKHVFAVWISPSGNGLKILIPISSLFEEHKSCFDSICVYFKNVYQISIDKSGSDVCRLCFYSHDENIIINESFEIYDYKAYSFVNPDIREVGSDKSETVVKSNQLTYFNEKRAYYDTLNRNDNRNRHTISAIIKFLKAKNISITSTYSEWYRVALAIADTFTFDIGSKYFLALCQLDGENHDEYKSIRLLEYCYRNRRSSTIKFATIIYSATIKGFKLRKL